MGIFIKPKSHARVQPTERPCPYVQQGAKGTDAASMPTPAFADSTNESCGNS